MLTKCWFLEEDMTIFGHVGHNVTLHSSAIVPGKERGVLFWYHKAHGGRSLFSLESYIRRDMSFTIEKLTFMDSGQYFAMYHENFLREFQISHKVLVVTGKIVCRPTFKIMILSQPSRQKSKKKISFQQIPSARR